MRSLVKRGAVRARQAVAVVAVLTIPGSSACGSDGGDSEQGPSISPLLDTEREASETVGPDGGTVTAAAADGTEYVLTLPADALIEETEISLTPIVSIDDLPMSGGFVAGVHFEPSGLELFRSATLTVMLPAAPSVEAQEALTGFVYDDTGENLALALAEADEDSFTLPVDHFSGGGSGAANPGELATASAPGSPNAFIAELVGAIQASDTETAESTLREWYETRVRPRLQAAVSNDEALGRALPEYRRWLNAEGAVSLDIDVAGLVSESRSLAANAFAEAIARANDLCERNASFEDAEAALRWQRRAESVLPESVLLQNGLDRSTVLVELCVQVVVESTSFPESPVVGEPATLSLVVGYSFGGGPTAFAEDMLIGVLATGATPGAENLITDELGEATLELTPTGLGINVEAEACIANAPGAGALTGFLVCQTAFIVRGLVVSPSTITLAPGSSQQFTAELLGVAEEVTWSAAGGSIDQSGLFVAGENAGTFTVTATSVANPSLTATARVTIESDTGEPVTTILHGTAQCVDVDDLGDVKPSGIRVMQMGSQLEIQFPRVVPQSTTPYKTPCIPDDVVYLAMISGDSFSGSTNDCSGGPCEISGSFDGSMISGRAVWDNVCVSTRCPQGCDCYTDFEATVAPECVDLSDRLACEL